MKKETKDFLRGVVSSATLLPEVAADLRRLHEIVGKQTDAMKLMAAQLRALMDRITRLESGAPVAQAAKRSAKRKR